MTKNEAKNIFYSDANSNAIHITSPQVAFTDRIPRWFIQQFINYMAKGWISVSDKDGNKLNVFYDSH